MNPAASGLTLYWAVSNVLQIGQQWLIYRIHPELLPASSGAPVIESRDVTPKKPSTNGGAAKPITTGRVTPAGGSNRSNKKKKRR